MLPLGPKVYRPERPLGARDGTGFERSGTDEPEFLTCVFSLLLLLAVAGG